MRKKIIVKSALKLYKVLYIFYQSSKRIIPVRQIRKKIQKLNENC